MTQVRSKSYFGKSRSEVSADLHPAESVVCPVCGTEPERFAEDFQGFQLCRCRDCGLQFVNPRLSFDQLSESVYNETYFPKYEESQTEAERYQFGRQLAAYRRLAGKTGRILDIGCGNGSFLRFAEADGWEISGSDIGLAEDARRLECTLWEGRLQDVDFGEERFDVIRMNHVLEHTQNPVADLKRVADLLLPEGILHISVPNIAGFSHRIKNAQSSLGLKKRRWRHYAAMHHLFFFTPRTLRNVVAKAGMRVLEWETPVLKKGGSELIEGIYRTIAEGLKQADMLDLYCARKD